MNRFLSRAMAASAGSFALMQAASAQVWWDDLCHLNIQNPYSVPYAIRDLPIGSAVDSGPADSLFAVTLGLSGTNTYSRSCWGTTADSQINVAGGIGFQSGAVGSIQSDSDDFLRMNFGMPLAVGSNIGYAVVVTRAADGALTRTRFGGIDTAFYTANDRAHVSQATVGGLRVTLRADQVGDGVRFSWTLANNGTAPVNAGLYFGQWVTFLDKNGNAKGADYVYVPGRRPIRTPTVFRTDGSSEFDMPQYMTFSPNREDAYGLRLENIPTEGATSAFPDLTPVDELRVGQSDLSGSNTGITGLPWEQSTFPESTLDEATFADYENPSAISNVSFLQKWQPTNVPGGGSREIVSYYRGTWGNSNFTRPYAVVVDAPRVIAVDPANPTQFLNNPGNLRVYIDNIRGYTTLDQEIPLEDVRVTVSFPQGGATLTSTGTTSETRFISRIAPRRVGNLDYPIRIADESNGDIPYRVTITTRTNANRVVDGVIKVSAQPRLPIVAGPNLVGTPYNYANGTWEAILGLRVDDQFRAFTWDPQQNEYVIQTGPQRGVGTWIVSEADLGVVPLSGSPSLPNDLGSGAPLITLKSGWNLISNPYPYPVPIGQLVGVSASTPEAPQTYAQLINSGVLSGAVATYDAATGQYVYLNSFAEPIQPNRGYWIFVNTDSDLTLSFPPIFEPFVPGGFDSSRAVRRWSLRVAGRTGDRIDSQNRIGVAGDSKSARFLNAVHAPLSPDRKAISVSVLTGGRDMASAFVTGEGTQTFPVRVRSRAGGNVSLSFPDIASVPANVKLTLVDPSSRRRVDLRSISTYSVRTVPNVPTTVQIVAETAVAAAPISNVNATPANNAGGRAVRVDYTIGQSGRVTVRAIRNGATVATIRRDMPQSGRQSIAWNFRDAAGRPVAPGTYTVEIGLVTGSGARHSATVDVIAK